MEHSNLTAYEVAQFGGQLQYKPETDAASDFTQLVHLIATLDNSQDNETFIREFSSLFDVDLFLRTYVMEVFTGNWDGTWNGNNYYLYLNPDVGKFQYFRHDLDLSFGMFEANPFSGNFSDRDVYTWFSGGRGWRLPSCVLSVPAYRTLFTQHFWSLLETVFGVNMDRYVPPSVSSLFYPSSSASASAASSTSLPSSHSSGANSFSQLATSLQALARVPALADNWHRVDYAWSAQEFTASLTETIVRTQVRPHVLVLGVEQFLATRLKSAMKQLDPP